RDPRVRRHVRLPGPLPQHGDDVLSAGDVEPHERAPGNLESVKRGLALLIAALVALGALFVALNSGGAPSASVAQAREEWRTADTSHARAELGVEAPRTRSPLDAPRTNAEPARAPTSTENERGAPRELANERAPATPLTQAYVHGRVIDVDDQLGRGGLALV